MRRLKSVQKIIRKEKKSRKCIGRCENSAKIEKIKNKNKRRFIFTFHLHFMLLLCEG
jgi:hypothetical protein